MKIYPKGPLTTNLLYWLLNAAFIFCYFIYFVASETITHNLLKQNAKPIQLLLGEWGFSQENSTEECGDRCGCPLAAPANKTVARFQDGFFFFNVAVV